MHVDEQSTQIIKKRVLSEHANKLNDKKENNAKRNLLI